MTGLNYASRIVRKWPAAVRGRLGGRPQEEGPDERERPMPEDDTRTLKPRYAPIREVLGDRAQSIAAATAGAYAFLVVMYFVQILCPLFGAGG